MNSLKRLLFGSVKTEEHFSNYSCKGLCHKDMRCVDLPKHEEVCASKELILPPETIEFLKNEIKKELKSESDAEYKQHIKHTLEGARSTRRCC